MPTYLMFVKKEVINRIVFRKQVLANINCIQTKRENVAIVVHKNKL